MSLEWEETLLITTSSNNIKQFEFLSYSQVVEFSSPPPNIRFLANSPINYPDSNSTKIFTYQLGAGTTYAIELWTVKGQDSCRREIANC